MIRRRLFAYTVMYTAGISAGFFIYERSRLVCGTLFMLASAMSGLLMTECCAADRSTRPDNGIRLAAALAAGFLVFTCRFISYGTAVDDSMIGEITSIEGTVKSVTAENGKVRLVISDTDVLRGLVSVLVTVRDTGDIVPAETAGSRIHAYGSLSVPLSADNPGCFDYRMYLRSRGIGYVFHADSIVMTGKRRGRYLKFLYRTRDGFLAYFSDPEIRGFIKGTVFGDKSEIREDIRDDFNENGTGHILAVSGLHIGMIYAMLYKK